MDWVRKIVFVEERVLAEAGKAVAQPITRVAGIAVIQNPFAGQGHVEDLASLFDVGAKLGQAVMPDVVRRLPHPATSYGKAAIVGLEGEVEHAAAIIHPRMGKPMRAAIGGGKAIIPSNVKVAVAGSSIDVPLSDRDDVWQFDRIDTITVSVPDAPRPAEIVVIVALSDGGRPRPRIDKDGARPLGTR